MTVAFHKGQRLCERFVLLESLYVSERWSVWQALDEQRSTQVAIKCAARSSAMADHLWQSMQSQYSLRLRLEHDHLLSVYEPVRDRDALVFPMQLAAGNASQLRGKSYRQWRAVAIDIARALAYMHAQGYVHGDLKPSNVLLDFRGEALLGDFDTARVIGESAPLTSPFSASPQRLSGEPLCIAHDLYGFGALLHEWMTGYPPYFPQRPDPAQMPSLPVLQCSAVTPQHLQQLVRDLLAHDPAQRPANMSAVIECLEREDNGELNTLQDSAEIFDITQVISATGPRTSPASEETHLPRKRRAVWWASAGGAAMILAGLWWGLPRLTEMQSTELTRAFAAAREAARLDPSRGDDRGDREGMITDGSAETPPATRYAELESEFNQLLSDLESRAAGVWGGESFAGGKSLGKLARDAADDRDWDVALNRITVATRRLQRVEELAPKIKAERLADANKALDTGQLELARQNFDLVRQLDPADNSAAEGLERVASLLAVLPVLADAETALLGGETLRALTLYEQVLRADRRNRAATQGLQQATLGLGNDGYGQAIGQALAALRAGEFAATEASLVRAAELNPAAPEIAAVRAQLAAARERRALDGERESIQALEQAERWSEALASYEQILARDPSLVFARLGRERVAPRARAEQRLNALLTEPSRLSSPEVRREAQRLLTQTQIWTTQATVPVLTRQREALQAELDRYAARMRAIIESDGLTEIRIQRVGVLGSFERKELELQPGRYVAIGTRPGFRDVRREFSLVPGEASPIVDVRCTEAIT
jgi:tetratricopeptide (TPR) repeat protein